MTFFPQQQAVPFNSYSLIFFFSCILHLLPFLYRTSVTITLLLSQGQQNEPAGLRPITRYSSSTDTAMRCYYKVSSSEIYHKGMSYCFAGVSDETQDSNPLNVRFKSTYLPLPECNVSKAIAHTYTHTHTHTHTSHWSSHCLMGMCFSIRFD